MALLILVWFSVILRAAVAPGVMSLHDNVQSRRVRLLLCTSLIRQDASRKGQSLPRPCGPVNLPWVPCLCLGYEHSWESECAAFSFLCQEGSKAKEKLREMWQLEREAIVSASGTWLSKPLDLLFPFSPTWEYSPYGRCQQIPAEPSPAWDHRSLLAPSPNFIPSFLPDSPPRFLVFKYN